MATARQVVDLHSEHPSLTASEIAKRLHCKSGYVRATASRKGIKLMPGRPGAQKTKEEYVHGG